MNARLRTTVLSIAVTTIILSIAILNIACEKREDITPAGKLIDSFRAEGLPIVETQFDSLTNTYTLTVPADADLANLILKPLVASGVSVSPDPSKVTDYNNPATFEVKKKKGAPQTIQVKVNKLPVGSSRRCLLTRIESMDHPDDYYTFEYNEGGLISRIRTSLLFSDWGTTEFRYANEGIGICESKDSHFGYSPRQIMCHYNSSGKLEKVMLLDWTSWVDWLGLGNMAVNEFNQYTGQPGNLVLRYKNRKMTSIEINDLNMKDWITLDVEYDNKKHFQYGSRPHLGIHNYFLFTLGERSRNSPEARIDLRFHMLSFEQNILRYIVDKVPIEDLQYTYNKDGFPITNETERLRFFYANCD